MPAHAPKPGHPDSPDSDSTARLQRAQRPERSERPNVEHNTSHQQSHEQSRDQTHGERHEEQGRQASASPEMLPVPVFLEFLRRLHDGPPQQAAIVRVALALWEQAAQRGDVALAKEALHMARPELDRLIRMLADLQETGRRWSGTPSPTHADLEAAKAAAAAWDAAVTHREKEPPA